MKDVVEIVPDKAVFGKAFKKEAKMVMDYLAELDGSAIKQFEEKLNSSG